MVHCAAAACEPLTRHIRALAGAGAGRPGSGGSGQAPKGRGEPGACQCVLVQITNPKPHTLNRGDARGTDSETGQSGECGTGGGGGELVAAGGVASGWRAKGGLELEEPGVRFLVVKQSGAVVHHPGSLRQSVMGGRLVGGWVGGCRCKKARRHAVGRGWLAGAAGASAAGARLGRSLRRALCTVTAAAHAAALPDPLLP